MKIIRRNTGGSKRLFLASLNPDLEKEILLPSVPDNFLTRGKFEDWQLKRICLYENIDDALSGLLQQKLNDKLVYIYEPVACKYENLIKPGITSVPYVLALPEWWYCNSLRVRLTHVIQVDKELKPLEFRYGPRQKKENILRWAWKEKLDKYGKSMVIKRFSEKREGKRRMIVPRRKLFSFNSDYPEIIDLGKGLILKKTQACRFMRWLGRHIKSLGRLQGLNINYDVYYKSEIIGAFSAQEVSRNEVNFIWINIYPEFEGKGYAQLILSYFIEAVRKKNRYRVITLEVPGISPNARHIYEKLGFKSTGKVVGDEKSDPIWGGLTYMKLNLK